MRFEWYPEKARANLSKHGVSFDTASEVFADPMAITAPDRFVDGEFRWRSVGRVGPIAIMFVAHTYRDDDGEEVVRLISARKARAHERRAYERGDETAIG